MCGIAGIFAYADGVVSKEELLSIRDQMQPRGPDGCGEWYSSDRRTGLAHRRLSIIDLSDAGAQPMENEDGSVVVVFNGEIYNFRELRKDLETKGHRFRSGSDTEVLLHLYSEKGIEMLKHLRGMFAFALWDERKKGMLIARDPFGIKPLYYSDDGNTLRVASQVKALLAGGAVDTRIEPAGHVGFFLWGHVPDPFTLYRGVKALPAGSFLWVDLSGAKRHGVAVSVVEELAFASVCNVNIGRDEMLEKLRHSLLDSVSHHLISDVPIGIFLSSGLDSTTLTGLSCEVAPGAINTVTLGFEEYCGTDNDETTMAEQVAQWYGTTHKTIWVRRQDFLEQLPHMLMAMDQPTVDGVNSFIISRAAVAAGLKVAISGLGGDELFGSYDSFRQIPRMVGLFKPFSHAQALAKAFRSISVPLLKHFTSTKYAGLFEYGGSYEGAYILRRGMFMPWELPSLLDGEIVKEGWKDLQSIACLGETIKGIQSDYHKISSLEMSWYMRNQLLRDCDWAGMAHSLEIRVPLVDMQLLKSVAPFMNAAEPVGKKDLPLTLSKMIPEAIRNRRKTGFSIPVREWLLEEYTGVRERGLRSWAKFVYGERLRGPLLPRSVYPCGADGGG